MVGKLSFDALLAQVRISEALILPIEGYGRPWSSELALMAQDKEFRSFNLSDEDCVLISELLWP